MTRGGGVIIVNSGDSGCPNVSVFTPDSSSYLVPVMSKVKPVPLKSCVKFSTFNRCRARMRATGIVSPFFLRISPVSGMGVDVHCGSFLAAKTVTPFAVATVLVE